MSSRNESIEALIAALEAQRRGAVEALAKALADLGAEHDEYLLQLSEHAHPGVRSAVVHAASARLASAGATPSDVLATIFRRAAGDVDGDVREVLARAVLAHPTRFDDDVRLALSHDESWRVRTVAAATLRGRAAGGARLLAILTEDEDDDARAAAAKALEESEPSACLGALVRALGRDSESPKVRRAAALALETILGSRGGEHVLVSEPRASEWDAAIARLRALGLGAAAHVEPWLSERAARDVDQDALREFGTLLTQDALSGRLPRAFGVDLEVDRLEAVVRGGGNRSAVLLGAPGVGKTAIVNELAHRLARAGEGAWHVLRFTPSDLLVGTKYLGEWQTRVQELVTLVRAPRRVILHVLSFHEFAEAGRTSKSDSSVATMLAPHIESGAVCVVGESSPETFRAGTGDAGALRRLFRPIDVLPRDGAATRAILRAICDEAHVTAKEADLERLHETADMFLAGAEQPARSAGLLRRVLERARGGTFDERDVLAALSSSTGVPVDLVDDAKALDLTSVRAFFEARVMGQSEAVDAVVDLVALVKAGLTDPHKPMGVLFFVGPTGVGKTELARALAEHLFGDPNRLLRIDMSEYALPGSAERLTGGPGRPGVLTGPVRDQPFTLVLLDEFEKAHESVFDLCLQIFDAGRLSDAQGTTVDFRRTIVVLTSNLGSAVPTESSVGFGRSTPRPPDEASVTRALREFFRPEFLNRIDRIVCFRPLALETAEKIVRRELARVLERSGIHRRGILVDVAPEALAFLLEDGYSPAFGARPLKRTIERRVLIPLARAIATGVLAPSSVASLTVKDRELVVDVHRDEVAVGASEETRAESSAETLRSRARVAATAVEELRSEAERWIERRSALFERANAPGFWTDRAGAQRALDELHRIDGCLARLEQLERESRGAEEHALRARDKRTIAAAGERLDRLEAARSHVAFLVGLSDPLDLSDAFVLVRRLRSRGPRLDAVVTVGRMLLAFAARRGYETQCVADVRAANGEDDVLVFEVCGAGAHALFAGEDGLHQFQRESQTPRGSSTAREIVRVEVLPSDPHADPLPRDDVYLETHARAGSVGRLSNEPVCERSLLHRPTRVSLRALTVTDDTILEPLLRLLAARVRTRAGRGSPVLVRRYDTGASPRVHDRRSGVRTGRIQRVLDGDLDAFRSRP